MNVIDSTENGPISDSFGRRIRQVRFRLNLDNSFKLIYRAAESIVAGEATGETLQKSEVVKLTKTFVALGVDHVHLSVSSLVGDVSLPELVSELKAEAGAKHVSLTTLDMRLAPVINDLAEAGLDEIHLSIDSLRPGRSLKITGRDQSLDSKLGFEAALASTIPTVVVNTVVMKGVNADEVIDFVALVEHTRAQIRFIELVPFAHSKWMEDAKFSADQIKADLASSVPMVQVPSELPSDVEVFRIPDKTGTIGIVATMSQSFCSNCDRVRFTSDGRLQSCQYSVADPTLRDELRSGATVEELTASAARLIAAKPKQRPEYHDLQLLAQRI